MQWYGSQELVALAEKLEHLLEKREIQSSDLKKKESQLEEIVESIRELQQTAASLEEKILEEQHLCAQINGNKLSLEIEQIKKTQSKYVSAMLCHI